MSWLGFTAAWAGFFVSHSVPLRPGVRGWLTELLGQRGFTLAYAGLSTAILAWLIVAAGRAPRVPLWFWAPWQSLVTLGLMFGVCLLLALSVGRANPFSFGGARNAAFDLRQPGIVRLTRHPLLLAMALWASAHIVPNGDLAHLILFGSFALFAALGGRMVDRRRRRDMGARWEEHRAAMAGAPLFRRPQSIPSLVMRIAAGIVLYLLLLRLHPVVIGVNPVPF